MPSGLQAGLRGDPSCVERAPEYAVVGGVLVGVTLGEACYRAVERVAGTEVAGDRYGVAGARVCPRECPAADLRVAGHRARVHRLDERRPLAVPKLADVKVTVNT